MLGLDQMDDGVTASVLRRTAGAIAIPAVAHSALYDGVLSVEITVVTGVFVVGLLAHFLVLFFFLVVSSSDFSSVHK